MPNKKRILVAPLNWGLGHAARCIPIIEALENHGYEPVLASDGIALALLKKEFPDSTAIELPGYPSRYPDSNGPFRKTRLLAVPRLMDSISREHKAIAELVKAFHIEGIISDNRVGVYCKGVPSVFLTHQLNPPPGSTTWITSAIHRMFLKKHAECWIPDVEGAPNLSGKLGHTEDESLKIKYIGPLSRLHKKTMKKRYDIMVILSGAEPQRSLLEEKLRSELAGYPGPVVFVCGKVEAEEKITREGNITFYNFMNTAALERAFNESEMVLCRSGYTTIMDLAHLGKKAFFIPTPGQYEQEYLAQKLKKAGIAPYASQSDFMLADLEKVSLYKGLRHINGDDMKWKDLFRLFESE